MFRSRLTTAALKINSCYSSLISERISGPSLHPRVFCQKRANHSVLQLELSPTIFLNEDRNEDNDFKKLMEPLYTHTIEKLELRTAYVNSINHWVQLPIDKVESVIEILHLLNSYIITIDDMIDKPALRSGIPPTHKIYGYEKTLIVSHALIHIIAEKIMALNNNEVLKVYNEEMMQYLKAQSMENSWQLNDKIPTIADYTYLVVLKTSYLRFTWRMMQILSNCKTDFTRLSKLFGRWGQYENDYGSVADEKYWKCQGFINDISGGNFSLPIVHAINTGTHEGDVVHKIIRQKTNDPEMKRYCLHLLKKLGSIEYTKQAAQDAKLQLKEEIERLGGNNLFLEVIDGVAEWKNDEVPIESSV